MSNDRVNITFPPGRLVMGSLYKPNTKDAEGNPLVVKSGPNMGQPRQDFFFAVAIPKTPGATHWANEAWGAQIWQVGNAAFPGGQPQRPDFAWKIEDGDSTIPNKRGKKPCEQQGWKGCWVLKFGGGYAPKLYTLVGVAEPAPLTQDGAIELGYWVQVAGSVSGNGAANQPGIYLNHNMVCLRAFDEKIVVGPDVASAGFGGGSLPPSASMAPVGGFTPPATLPMPPAVPGAPAVPATPAPLPAVPAAVPVVPVIPNPAMLGIATPPAVPAPPAPAAPVAPAVPAGPVMLPAANGVPYEAYKAQGWTDDMLRSHGFMQ